MRGSGPLRPAGPGDNPKVEARRAMLTLPRRTARARWTTVTPTRRSMTSSRTAGQPRLRGRQSARGLVIGQVILQCPKRTSAGRGKQGILCATAESDPRFFSIRDEFDSGYAHMVHPHDGSTSQDEMEHWIRGAPARVSGRLCRHRRSLAAAATTTSATSATMVASRSTART